MDDIRWFAPNAYCELVVPYLRRQGLAVAVEGRTRARLAFAMSGRSAVDAWHYARQRRCPLVVYIWDLPPQTETGRYDPIWHVAGRFLRMPRLLGGYPRRRGYYSRLRYVAARAAMVWVPSQMTRGVVDQRYGVETVQVPYCYDSERFFPRVARRMEPPEVLAISRLRPHKNQMAVIHAAARLDREVRVRLIGRGPEGQRLANIAAELGVDCRVETEADDATVTQAYQTAQVLVCPSRFEGFGLTPLEGVASGIPVVASDIPPHREFVGAAATLVPLDDDAAMATAISEALDARPADPDLVRDLTIDAAGERFLASLAPLLR